MIGRSIYSHYRSVLFFYSLYFTRAVQTFTCTLSPLHSVRFVLGVLERVESEFFQCVRPNYIVSNAE